MTHLHQRQCDLCEGAGAVLALRIKTMTLTTVLVLRRRNYLSTRRRRSDRINRQLHLKRAKPLLWEDPQEPVPPEMWIWGRLRPPPPVPVPVWPPACSPSLAARWTSPLLGLLPPAVSGGRGAVRRLLGHRRRGIGSQSRSPLEVRRRGLRIFRKGWIFCLKCERKICFELKKTFLIHNHFIINYAGKYSPHCLGIMK